MPASRPLAIGDAAFLVGAFFVSPPRLDPVSRAQRPLPSRRPGATLPPKSADAGRNRPKQIPLFPAR